MVGRTFGKWTVTGEAPKIKSGVPRYFVTCECGKESNVDGYRLLTGSSRQCQSCSKRNPIRSAKAKAIRSSLSDKTYAKRSSSYDKGDGWDSPDTRDGEFYKTLSEAIGKLVIRYCRRYGRIKENDILKRYPEARIYIKGIMGMLEFGYIVTQTHHVNITYWELVPDRERELELARRQVKEETIHSTSANSMLFTESTAKREMAKAA